MKKKQTKLRSVRPLITKKQRKVIRADHSTPSLFPTPLCSRCRINPVYLDIGTMDWCESCINEHVQDMT